MIRRRRPLRALLLGRGATLLAIAFTFCLVLATTASAAPTPVPAYLMIQDTANDLALEASANACDFAHSQPADTLPRVLLLDFGKAYRKSSQYGAQTSTKFFHSNDVILRALKSAAGEYWSCGSDQGKSAIITYGNTNSKIAQNMTISQIHDAGYYQQQTVLNLANYESTFGYASREDSAGASDMELAWAGPRPTQALVTGEQGCGGSAGPGACGHPYFDFGDAHGCPLSGSSGNCYGSWTVTKVANISFSNCCQNLPLPEIYDSGKAAQWTGVRKNWDNNHSSNYVFGGTTGIDCSSLTPQQGWDLLSSMNPYVRNELLDFRPACGTSAAPRANAARARANPARAGGAPLLGPPSPTPARIQSAKSTAIPGAVLRPTNQWIVSNGPRTVLVTAGAAGNDSSVGRFVILRENLAAVDPATGVEHGRPQRIDEVDVPGSGAVAITAAPEGPGAENRGLNGELEFRGTSGLTGTLHLSNDTVTTNSAK